jgi:1,4-dihydroxy-2-naphthoate octaprenyltransferase
MNNISVTKLLNLLRPLFLLGGFLLFALGTGIAHYLGHPVNWTAYLLGQACILFLQLAIIFLSSYYESLQIENLDIDNGDKRLSSGIIEKTDGKYRLTSQSSILVAATVLTSGFFFTLLLLRNGYLDSSSITILILIFLITLFYAAPPIRLVYSGYGELTLAILLANLVPALAFILQTGNLHRLIVMATFPLTPIYLAMSLALSLQNYYEDINQGKKTLLVRLGWQRGMNLHNILILVGFLLIILAITTGLPWRIAWPTLLALPLGLFQIWQMSQIADGAKPRWRILSVTALATFGLIAYFFTFSFWIA